MAHRQILPTPPTVEYSMDDIAVTLYNCTESAFNFEVWQETPQCELPSLIQCSSLHATATPSTDSTSEGVIHNVLLQFQPQHRKGKAPV